MKLEIELDFNKIDYDSINKQIQEKVEALNISEMSDIEDRINTILNVQIRNVYGEYIGREYYTATYDGKRIIQDLVKEKFTEVVRKIIDDIYKEKEIEELVVELFPKLFVQAMYDVLRSNIQSSTMRNEETTINHAVNIVAGRLNSRGIQF